MNLLAAILITAAAGSACGETCGICAPPPRYDLTIVEGDSGTGGVSVDMSPTGMAGVGFVLDARRSGLTALPHLNITGDDAWKQFPGKRVWGVVPVGVGTKPTNTDGAFEVTATGGGLAPFTFHLVIGSLVQPGPVKAGDVIVQQWNAGCGEREPKPLGAPDFQLIQDTHVSVLQSIQFAFKRRAYRVLLAGRVPPPIPPADINVPDLGPCLPSDFPRYSTVQTQRATSNTRFTLQTNSPQDLVFGFYKVNLDELDWRIESTAGWTIKFTRRSNFGIKGTVSVDSNGDVQVEFPVG